MSPFFEQYLAQSIRNGQIEFSILSLSTWSLNTKGSYANSKGRNGKSNREKRGIEKHMDEGAKALGFVDSVRQTTRDMIVDTGAVAVRLPENIIAELGLPKETDVTVKLADGSKRAVPLYGDLKIEIVDDFGNIQQGVFHVLGKPNDAPCILGQIVLEDMDFVVDCRNQKLIPNPEAPEGMMLYEDF